MFNEQEIKARIIAKCEGRSYILQELIIEMQAKRSQDYYAGRIDT